MKPDNRLDLRIDPSLKAAVRAEAERRGQSLTVFTERALEAALSASETPEAPRTQNAIVEARKRAAVRGSASPSLERFAKPQPKGKR